MIDKTFEELKSTGNFPSPCGVAFEILKLTQSEQLSVAELVHTINADPVLTGRVLKIVNSDASEATKIISVQAAVAQLGLAIISDLAHSLSIVAPSTQQTDSLFNYNDFWISSLIRGLALREIAHYHPLLDADQALNLGSVVEIGQLAMAQIYPQVYSSCLEARTSYAQFSDNFPPHHSANHQPNFSLHELLQKEHELFAIDHNQITLKILDDWGLPKILIKAVEFSHDLEVTIPHPNKEQQLAIALKLASLIAEYVKGNCTLDSALQLCEKLTLTTQQLQSIVDSIWADLPSWDGLLDLTALSNPHSQHQFTNELTPTPHALTNKYWPADMRVHAHDDIATSQIESNAAQLRILLIDDDRTFVHLLRNYLINQGHAVISTLNSDQGLKALLSFNPQVVIVDYMMEPIDGLTFCKLLRSSKANHLIYVILITAETDPSLLTKAFECGVNDFITKPIKKIELDARLLGAKHMVDKILGLHSEADSLRHHAYNLASSSRRFEEVALMDALTQLPNRRYAIQILDKAWNIFQQEGQPFGLLSLDLDLFKQINDNYGHSMGDKVLIHFAKILKASIRKHDLACRIGGEEFIVISPGINQYELSILGERIRAMVEKNQPENLSLSHIITVSIGGAITNLAEDQNGWNDTLNRSDQALYRAKQCGRNLYNLH